MVQDYIYQAPSMVSLMDPRVALANVPRTDRVRPKHYEIDFLAESPESARKAGSEVSGRIISVTTNFAHVVTRDAQAGKFSVRPRRGLSSLYGSIAVLQQNTSWESVLVSWPGEIEVHGTETGNQLKISSVEKLVVKTLLENATNKQVEPVWLEGPYAQWRSYAERVLWPSFHYMQNINSESLGGYHEGYDNYIKLNELFCEAVLKVYHPGDIIWIHDFYFLALPAMLRKKLPDAYIGLYIHTPFPSSEFIRCIPERDDLLRGMLGSTMLAMQSQSYVSHFVSSCMRVLDVDHSDNKIHIEGRVVPCVSLPVGINAKVVEKEAASETVQAMVKDVKSLYKGKTIIIGRDKLDSVNSVLQKLRAFAFFLQEYPEWRHKVVLIQITTTTYNYDVRQEKQVSEMITEINGTFGNIEFVPIRHYTRHIDQREYYAFMQAADLGFFTTIRDSGNHAALEYIACKGEKGGPFIVSEFMGSAPLLGRLCSVNPYDAMSVAQAINRALTTREAFEYDVNRYHSVRRFDTYTWTFSFLSKLLRHELKHESVHFTPELNLKALKESYQKASKRVLLFDYDGTLTPIVKDPADAVPSERLKAALTKLCSDEKNSVWIISGRDQRFLDKWLGEYHLSLSAEHGCFLKLAGGKEWKDLVAETDMSWYPIVMEVLQSYTERTQGAVIETKKAAITWHYRRADPEFGAFQARHLRSYLEVTVAKNYGVEVMSGKANIEIRPKLFNKGEIVRMILEDVEEQPSFALTIGDDTTDEDMFRELNKSSKPNFYSILVGPSNKRTVATSRVRSPEVVHEALDLLVG